MAKETGPAGTRCASCGASLAGPFCSACGEKRRDPGDLSLLGFLGRGVTSVLDLERGLLPSLRLLLTRPGFLTTEYLAGRRVRHTAPLRLFLFVNVLYFLVQPHLGTNTYNTDLRSHTHRQAYSAGVAPVVERTLAARGVDPAAYAAAFDARGATLARSLVMALAVMMALGTLIPAPRGTPAVGRLVFGLHFYAYFLLVGSILLGLAGLLIGTLVGPRAAGPDPARIELIGSLLMLGVAMLWLVPAWRRVFGHGWLRSAASGLALALLLFPSIFLYRYLLFWATWLTV